MCRTNRVFVGFKIPEKCGREISSCGQKKAIRKKKMKEKSVTKNSFGEIKMREVVRRKKKGEKKKRKKEDSMEDRMKRTKMTIFKAY